MKRWWLAGAVATMVLAVACTSSSGGGNNGGGGGTSGGFRLPQRPDGKSWFPEVIEDPDLWKVASGCAKEAFAVAKARGVKLEIADCVEYVRAFGYLMFKWWTKNPL